MFITGSLKSAVSGRCRTIFRGASVLSLLFFQVPSSGQFVGWCSFWMCSCCYGDRAGQSSCQKYHPPSKACLRKVLQSSKRIRVWRIIQWGAEHRDPRRTHLNSISFTGFHILHLHNVSWRIPLPLISRVCSSCQPAFNCKVTLSQLTVTCILPWVHFPLTEVCFVLRCLRLTVSGVSQSLSVAAVLCYTRCLDEPLIPPS